MESFRAPEDAEWAVAIEPDWRDLVVHHDLAPWNLVVDGDRMTFIDWDGCDPGSRLWDLSYAAHGFALNSRDVKPVTAGGQLAALVDGYRLGVPERAALVPMLGRRARSMYDLLVAGHASGRRPWSTLYDEGHADHWGPISDYLTEHQAEWAAALGVI